MSDGTPCGETSGLDMLAVTLMACHGVLFVMVRRDVESCRFESTYFKLEMGVSCAFFCVKLPSDDILPS